MAGGPNSYRGINLPLRSETSQLSGERTVVAKMEQIIFWAAWNEGSLQSPSLQTFQTLNLCYAKFFLLLHGVAEPPTLSDWHFLFFLGGFLCLGLPGATWQGWLRYANPQPSVSISAPFWETYMPSHPPPLHGFCLLLSEQALTHHSLSQPFTPICSPDFLHFLLEASSIHQTQNVHKESKPLSFSTYFLHDRKEFCSFHSLIV